MRPEFDPPAPPVWVADPAFQEADFYWPKLLQLELPGKFLKMLVKTTYLPWESIQATSQGCEAASQEVFLLARKEQGPLLWN